MTSTWHDLDATSAPGDTLTAVTWNELIDCVNFLQSVPCALYALSASDSNVTTSSATLIDTVFDVTVITQKGDLEILFSGRVTSANFFATVTLDGVDLSGDASGFGAAVANGAYTIRRIVDVTAGSHRVILRMKSSSGSVSIVAASIPQLFVREIGSVTT